LVRIVIEPTHVASDEFVGTVSEKIEESLVCFEDGTVHRGDVHRFAAVLEEAPKSGVPFGKVSLVAAVLHNAFKIRDAFAQRPQFSKKLTSGCRVVAHGTPRIVWRERPPACPVC